MPDDDSSVGEAAVSVGVVVPVYNRPRVVLDALNGVLAQTYRPTRVVVVDDGSSDDTPERVRQWLAGPGEPLDTRLLQQHNQGVSAARNHGASELVDCELLAFLDSDDIWPTDYLERAAAAMAARGDAVAATADRLNVDVATGEQERRAMQWLTEQATARMFTGGPPGMSNTVYRARRFFELGGFDPELPCAEDFHMHLRMSLHGPWLHLPGEPVTYRRHTLDSPDERQQLSKRYDERRRISARMLERFLNEEGGAAVIDAEAARKRLSRAWHSAGRHLRQFGRGTEAAACYRQAVMHNPRHVRARFWAWWLGRAKTDAK